MREAAAVAAEAEEAAAAGGSLRSVHIKIKMMKTRKLKDHDKSQKRKASLSD